MTRVAVVYSVECCFTPPHTKPTGSVVPEPEFDFCANRYDEEIPIVEFR